MVSKMRVALVLILMVPISAHATDGAEPLPNGHCDDPLLSGLWLEEGSWDLDSDPECLELLRMDWVVLYDMLVEICLELQMTNEEVNEIFIDPWEEDYGHYLFWEDDW